MNRFRRLILELGHGTADPETIAEAAAFAQLMDAELHALFVEDETLLHASALPFAREISPLSYQWRKLEPGRLEAELKAAADRARAASGGGSSRHRDTAKFRSPPRRPHGARHRHLLRQRHRRGFTASAIWGRAAGPHCGG